MDKNSRDYEVCLCRGVTRGTIEDFLAETKITDLHEVCEQLEVGDVCGACRETIMEIIEDSQK
jgi:bacterioferritin-associated ferredoxin